MVKEAYVALKQLKFEKLKHRYTSLMKDLATYQGELKNYLIEDAMRSDLMALSTTYLIFDANNYRGYKQSGRPLKLLGYVSILNDSISLSPQLKEEFRDKAIPYKSLPALKIGRLCVDDSYLGRGIGKLVLAFCVKRAVELNKQISCRFITLDAKRTVDRSKDSLHFYKKFGFQLLIHKIKLKSLLWLKRLVARPCTWIYFLSSRKLRYLLCRGESKPIKIKSEFPKIRG